MLRLLFKRSALLFGTEDVDQREANVCKGQEEVPFKKKKIQWIET